MKAGKMLLGGLAGMATGALLGMLLAPDKGSNTRKQILNKGEDYANSLKDKLSGLMSTVNEKKDQIRDKAEDLIAKSQNKYEAVKNATT